MIELTKKIFKLKNNYKLASKILELCPYKPYLNLCPNLFIRIICRNCNNKQDAINKAIDICGAPNTDEKLYLYAIAYANSKKEYRKLALKYLNECLNTITYKNDDTLKEFLADILTKEYKFDEALKIYEELIKNQPKMPILYEKKVNVLIKSDKINTAIEFLKNVKKSEYYRDYTEYAPNSWFIDTIDELLNNCEELKKKNYVYKPRKSNINYV